MGRGIIPGERGLTSLESQNLPDGVVSCVVAVDQGVGEEAGGAGGDLGGAGVHFDSVLFHPHGAHGHGRGAGDDFDGGRVGRGRRGPGGRPVVWVEVVGRLELVRSIPAEVVEHLGVDVEGGKGGELGVDNNEDEQRAQVVGGDVRPDSLHVMALRASDVPVFLLGVFQGRCALLRLTCRVLDEVEV